ncbi:MAG: hypothetical protein AB1744_03540 [Candidatus Zixiibacteriota bacterium]
MMFGLFSGKRFCEDVAAQLGVNAALFSSALMEVGITWAHFKQLKKTGTSATDALNVLAPPFEEGLAIVRARFGAQREIVEAEEAVAKWRQSHVAADKNADEPDFILSSEFPRGRFQLSYPVETGERIRGTPRTAHYVLRSDDLEALKRIALIKQMGGVQVTLTDTMCNAPVPEQATPPDTDKEWLIENASHLKGVQLQFRRYTAEGGHYCAACSTKFSDRGGPGTEREGYTTMADYVEGACAEWVCATCYDELRKELQWKPPS